MNGEYPNYPREMVEEFEAQIAALTKERDDLLKLTNVQEQLPVPRLREQLKDEHIQHKRWQMACAASQAREAKLREALEHYRNMASPRSWDGSPANAALALPTDDTALQQRLAEEREKCAQQCDDEASIEGIAQRCATKIRSMK